MEKPISVGDLVVVVRVCNCGCPWHLGAIFQVSGFYVYKAGGKWKCTRCGGGGTIDVDSVCAEGHLTPISIALLKRIPPLDELETVRQSDEVTQ